MIKIDLNELHQNYLEQWIQAIKKGNINQAIIIDFKHYNEIVKPIESQEYWDKWQNDTFQIRREINQRFVDILPTKIENVKNERILIIHHNYSGLANECQIARSLEYLKKDGFIIEIEIAYLFGGDLKQLNASAELYKIEKSSVFFLQSKNYTDAGNRLNWLINNKKYKTLLYPSIFPMAFWMSLYVNHMNQKFHVLKYFPKQVGRINYWSCGRRHNDKYYEIDGSKFIQLSVLNPKIKENPYDNKIFNKKIIKRIGGAKLNFGSISRPEKISNINYNNFILKILNQDSSLNYIYTGRESGVAAIPEEIRNHPQSKHIGWVNPNEAIELFDIYLEPFPWGGGDMTFLALESACPYLILDTPQNRLVGVYGFVSYLSVNAPKILEFSFCKSEEIMMEKFKKLVKNEDLRHDLGLAWAETIYKYRPVDKKEWVKFLKN